MNTTKLMIALKESVKLQAHYAELLNGLDGGKRIVFKDVDDWLLRLTQGGKFLNVPDELRGDEYLTPAMDNVLASTLGQIALDVGRPGRDDVGDSIDRGLILRRILSEHGFKLIFVGKESKVGKV